jgi:hypothetical protein
VTTASPLLSSDPLDSRLSFAFRSPVALILTGFTASMLVLIFLGAGSVVRYTFPGLSALIGFYLYLRAPYTYVSFVWWLFFLTSFIRRVVDYRTGWLDSDPILVAPYLAALACAPALFRRSALWRCRATLPFSLAFATVMYGAVVGLLCLPKSALPLAYLNWFTPLVFGFYMYSEYTDSNRASGHTQALRSTFTWGLLAMAVYGIAQFVLMPKWDALWMTQTEMSSIGIPEPFGMRVFSTMNGPGVFAFLVMAALLLLTQSKDLVAVAASTAGYAAFLLTTVRAAWIAWLVAVCFLAVRQTKQMIRLITAIAILSLCLFAMMALQPVKETLQPRFESFAGLRDDASFEDRSHGYGQMVGYALSDPLGSGLGAMDAIFADKTSLGTRDSGFWEVILSLGWTGGAAYLFALALAIWLGLRPGVPRAPFETTAASISLGLASQMFLGSMMLGGVGVLIWSFAGIAMARYARLQNQRRQGGR